MGWDSTKKRTFKAGEIPGKGRMSGAESWRLDANAPKRQGKLLKSRLDLLWRRVQMKLGLNRSR